MTLAAALDQVEDAIATGQKCERCGAPASGAAVFIGSPSAVEAAGGGPASAARQPVQVWVHASCPACRANLGEDQRILRAALEQIEAEREGAASWN